EYSANDQEAEELGRFRLSRRRFERVQRSFLDPRGRLEIRAEARPHVCLRRWPPSSHQARPELSRALHAGTGHLDSRARLFLQWGERVQRQRSRFSYHVNKYK